MKQFPPLNNHIEKKIGTKKRNQKQEICVFKRRAV